MNGVFTPYIGSINYCLVHSLAIESPNEAITSVNGLTTPTTFQGLNFYGMVVQYLPKNIGKFFPQLRGLTVWSTGLKAIQAADLENLSHLESVYINQNEIEELNSDLFKFTPKINDVYFGNNQISHVGKDLLTKINSFKRINFMSNKCIDSAATSDFESFKTELRTKCPDPMEKYCSEFSKELENEITSLKTKHLEREAEVQKEIEDVKSQKSSMELEIDALKSKHLQREGEVQKEIEDLKSEKSSMELMIYEIKTEMEEFKSKNSDLVLEKSKLQKEINVLKSQNSIRDRYQ